MSTPAASERPTTPTTLYGLAYELKVLREALDEERRQRLLLAAQMANTEHTLSTICGRYDSILWSLAAEVERLGQSKVANE